MTDAYFDSPYVTITWDDSLRCVHAVVRGFVPTPVMEEGMAIVLRLLIEKKAHAILADLRDLTLTDIKDQAWVARVWIPQAEKHGLQFPALVLPNRALARLGVKAIETLVRNVGTKPTYFTTPEAARAWLQTVL